MGRLWPAVVFVAVVAVAGTMGLLVESAAQERVEAATRAHMRAMADNLSLRLEMRISANMQIAEGLASYVAANPGLTSRDFAGLAASLLRHRSEVRNIGLARDTTIVAVYPLEGNEVLLGVDYRDIPGQWESARLVRETGQPMVAGPVTLIQGGRAIIGRMPVFVETPLEDGTGRKFWGIVGIPIDIEALFANAGLIRSLPWDIAIRGVDGRGADGAVFEGREETFQSPLAEIATVRLPGGSWQVAVAPRGGTAGGAPVSRRTLALFLFGGLLLGGIGAVLVARLRRGATSSPVG